MPYVENYQLEVSDNDCGNDNVVVRISLRSPQEHDVVKELKDRFRAKIRVAPDVEVADGEELRRAVFVETSRKPVKFVDNRRRN